MHLESACNHWTPKVHLPGSGQGCGPPSTPPSPIRMQRQQQDLPTDPNGMAETEVAELTQQLTHRLARHPSLLAEPAAKL